MGRRAKQAPTQDTKRTRLLRNILSAIWTLHDVNGSSANQIASFLRQQPRARLPRRHVLVQIRRVLRRAQESGLVVEQRGRYRLLIKEGVTPFPACSDLTVPVCIVEHTSKKKSRCGKRCPSCHRRLRILRVAQNKRLGIKRRRRPEIPAPPSTTPTNKKAAPRKNPKSSNTIGQRFILGRRRQPSPATSWREFKSDNHTVNTKSTKGTSLSTSNWFMFSAASSSSKESLLSNCTSADVNSTSLDYDGTDAITRALSTLSLKTGECEEKFISRTANRKSRKFSSGGNGAVKHVAGALNLPEKMDKQSKTTVHINRQVKKCANIQSNSNSTPSGNSPMKRNCLTVPTVITPSNHPASKKREGFTTSLKATEKQVEKHKPTPKKIPERPDMPRKKNKNCKRRAPSGNRSETGEDSIISSARKLRTKELEESKEVCDIISISGTASSQPSDMAVFGSRSSDQSLTKKVSSCRSVILEAGFSHLSLKRVVSFESLNTQ